MDIEKRARRIAELVEKVDAARLAHLRAVAEADQANDRRAAARAVLEAARVELVAEIQMSEVGITVYA